MDPRQYFPAQEAAYAVTAPMIGALCGAVVIDCLLGMDLGGFDVYGVVAQEPDGSLIVAFRGTNDNVEWEEDFSIASVPTPLGLVSGGVWLTFNTLKTASGVPLSVYAQARVCGHSRGGPLAILWAVTFASPEYCLFACPKLVGQTAVGMLSALNGMAWHVDGDIVPDVAPSYPSLPAATRVAAPSGTDLFSIAQHHIFSTYEAAITAYLAKNPTTP